MPERRTPPAELAHRCGPVVHAIGPGQRLGGPRVAQALLALCGERLARELAAREPASTPHTETRR